MDRKKLFGTIIGVAAFIALVAGAAYAALILQANVTNGNYSGTSRNFTITYNGGTAISAVKVLNNGTASVANITSESSAAVTTDGWVAVTASKANGDAQASHFMIKLNVTTLGVSTSSLSYVVCRGACPSGTLATISSGNATCTTVQSGDGLVKCGVVPSTTANGSSVTLYDDQTTFNTLSAASATYNVYFWLDRESLADSDFGTRFSGTISAEATQGEGTY